MDDPEEERLKQIELALALLIQRLPVAEQEAVKNASYFNLEYTAGDDECGDPIDVRTPEGKRVAAEIAKARRDSVAPTFADFPF